MYLVMVELNARSADQYGDLEKALKALGNWSNRMRGVWMIETRFTAQQVRDLLKPCIVPGQDRLLVARMTTSWAATGMGEGFQEWMNRRQFTPPAK
jgi:hypothetical protein